MGFEDSRGLLQFGEEPVVFNGLFFRLGCEWVDALRLKGEAPMQVDPTKVGRFVEEVSR